VRSIVAYGRSMRNAARYVMPTVMLSTLFVYRIGANLLPLDFLIIVVLVALTFRYAAHYASDVQIIWRYLKSFDDGSKPLNNNLSLDNAIYAANELGIKWHGQRAAAQYWETESTLLFHSVPDPVFALDRALNIIRINDAALNVFGSAAQHHKISDIIHHEGLISCVKRAVSCAQDSRIEVDLTANVGHFYVVTVRCMRGKDVDPIGLLPRPAVSVLVITQDITARKHKEKIDADFIANASHEIRTPLTTIFGFVETMRRDNLNRKTMNEFLDIIASQCSRINSLMNDISHLYLLDSSERPRPYRIINVRAIIEGALRDFSLQIQVHNIEVIRQYDEDALLTVGDSEGLYSVFSNLISNSVKYSHKNSQLRVVCQNASNGGRRPLICIKFIDQSDGIPEQDVPRLTERFYRADVSRSSKVPGTGLGLSIVQSIIHQHNGSLEIKSVLGKGSEFIILLPSAKSGRGAPVVSRASATRIAGSVDEEREE
jgi:two-component system phosphate regulon sensor histidine kinase PhoR